MTTDLIPQSDLTAALALLAEVKTLQVDSAQAHAAMEAKLAAIRQVEATLEAQYKANPVYVAFHALRDQKTRLADDLEQTRKEAKARQIAWEEAQEKARQEAEAKLAAELAKDTPPEVIAPMVVLPKTTPTTRSQVRWGFKIVNANIIPRQFLKPDETAIGRVVTALKSAANIPGVEIFSRKV